MLTLFLRKRDTTELVKRYRNLKSSKKKIYSVYVKLTCQSKEFLEVFKIKTSVVGFIILRSSIQEFKVKN